MLKLFDPRIATISPFHPPVYTLRDPEEEIAEALYPKGVLLAIGNKGTSYGAAKVLVSDDKWQAEFHRLATTAGLIFVAPAISAGLAWELSQLGRQEEYFRKTIFIMPHNWFGDEWEQMRTRLRDDFGFELPRYCRKGGYFRLTTGGALIGMKGSADFMNELAKLYQCNAQSVLGDDVWAPNRSMSN